jgi:hypothetical protein
MGIDCLNKGAFADTIGWSNMGSSKILLLQNLQQVSSRGMFFEMEVGQNFQLILKSHL